MTTTTLVLEEFRLHSGDHDGAAARIVAGFPSGTAQAVPLLTSIDDPRDVATIRVLRDGEATDPGERDALDPLVARWQPVKHYGPRILEQANGTPSHYRLAVTESGINTTAGSRATPGPVRSTGALRPLDLLWIGAPLDTHAGLMILIGDETAREGARSGSPSWPLPLSEDLGVRIYESRE